MQNQSQLSKSSNAAKASSNRIRPLKKKSSTTTMSDPILEDITKMIPTKPLGTEIDELLVQTMSLLDGKIVQIQEHITERKSNPENPDSVIALQDALSERNSSIKRNLRRILDMQSAPLALWMKPFSNNNTMLGLANNYSNSSHSNASTTTEESLNAHAYNSVLQQQNGMQYFVGHSNEQQYYDVGEDDDYSYEDERGFLMKDDYYEHNGVHEAQNGYNQAYYMAEKQQLLQQQQQTQALLMQGHGQSPWQESNLMMKEEGGYGYDDENELFDEENNELSNNDQNNIVASSSTTSFGGGGGGSADSQMGVQQQVQSSLQTSYQQQPMQQLAVRSDEECRQRLEIFMRFEMEYGIEIPKFFKCNFYLKKTPRQRFFQYMRDKEFKGVAKLYEILKTQQRVAELLDTSVPNVKRILMKVQAEIPSSRKPKIFLHPADQIFNE